MCSLDGYDDVTKIFNVSIILTPNSTLLAIPFSKHLLTRLIAYTSIFMIISENENGYMTEKVIIDYIFEFAFTYET